MGVSARICENLIDLFNCQDRPSVKIKLCENFPLYGTSYILLQPPQLSRGSRSPPERGYSHRCILSHRGTRALPGDGGALCPASECPSDLYLSSAWCHSEFWCLSCTTCLQWPCHSHRWWWGTMSVCACVCVCVCVCAYMRACMHACVHAFVRACVWIHY